MSISQNNINDQGVVIKKTIGNYSVYTNGRTILCELSNRLWKELVYPTADPSSLRHSVRDVRINVHMDPVAVGDTVRFVNAHNGSSLIVEVLPRRNKLVRRSAVPMPGAHAFEQVIAANVDQVVPVFSATNPAPKWHLLDRYLASAESLEIPALVCITKLDLVQAKDNSSGDELNHAAEEYQKIGYPVIFTSSVTGEGLGTIQNALKGRISVFVGKSGVGKTSLLNAIQPGLGLRVNEVNHTTGKGKHTTTHMEMFLLDFGGSIIDTPGIREFGLWDLDNDDLALFFPEMRQLIGRCKFALDCQHENEPGCAIRKAVTAGQISPRRYQSYLQMKVDGYFI